MARYRRHRTDFHAHENTSGLSALACDLFWLAIERGGLLGILERSPRRMAAQVGNLAPGIPCTSEHVEAALVELEEAGVARWWPELETLWIIEAADEQAKGSKAWDSCRSQCSELSGEVAAAVRKKYAHLSDRKCTSYQGVDEDSSPRSVPVPVPVTDPGSASGAETAYDAWGGLIPVLTELAPEGRSFDMGLTPPPGLVELQRDGWTRERIEARLRELAAAMKSGAIEARWWRWHMFELKNWRILADELSLVGAKGKGKPAPKAWTPPADRIENPHDLKPPEPSSDVLGVLDGKEQADAASR